MNRNERLKVQSDLLLFTEYCFLANNKEFKLNHHHRLITNALEKVLTGKIKRLIINIPPRYSKTELAVVSFMAWAIGLFPDSEFIHVSYSKRLATNNAYNCRALVLSDAYKNIFPDIKLMDDSKAKDEWRTEQGGVVYASGSDGTITGYGAGKVRSGFGGAIIIDDPHKAGEADSDLQRQNVIDWFQTTIESRLNNPSETPIIVIMQRLHQDDLSGWLLNGGNEEDWYHLKLPALNDDNKPLWPDKHTFNELERMRLANPYVFAGQYMQEPAPKEGGLIKENWIQRYRVLPNGNRLRVIQSWDTAYKASEINDPSVCTTWLETDTGYYLLDVYRFRGEYPIIKRAIRSKYTQFNPDVVLIEDKASGQSLIQELKQETNYPIIPIKPEADKETRLYAVSILFESGRVYFPENADWLADYEAELFMFPKAKHDDQVDSTSQALNYIKKKIDVFVG